VRPAVSGRTKLPGQHEVDVAVSTITAALSQVDQGLTYTTRTWHGAALSTSNGH